MNKNLVAHRGYSSEYPENTLLSIESALALGACFVEIDVHLSADKVPVVIHDANLTRTAGKPVNIMELEFSQLLNYSVHEPKRFGNKFLPQKISSLQTIVEVFKNKPRRRLFVEVKRASIRHFGIDVMLDNIIPVIEPIKNHCALISFDSGLIGTAKQRRLCDVGWIFEQWDEQAFSIIDSLKPNYLFTDYSSVPEEIDLLPSGTWSWAVYTIDDPELALHWLAKGADLVETNNYGKLVKNPRFVQYRCEDD